MAKNNIVDEWKKLSHEERNNIVHYVYSDMSAAEKKIISETGKGITRNLAFLAKSKRGDSATAKMGDAGAIELMAALGVWMVQNNYGG